MITIGKLNKDLLNEELKKVEGLTKGLEITELPATVTVDGYEIQIEADGTVTFVEEPGTPGGKGDQGDGDGTPTPVTPGTAATKTEKNNYTDESGKKATIPEGFTVSEDDNTIDDGLVVTGPDGSEFVWVPVTNYEKFKRTAGYSNGVLDTETFDECGEAGKDGKNEKIEESGTTKDEAKAMYASVEQNGGFYIARYEAGKEGGKVVSKKNVTAYNCIPWGDNITESTTTGAVKESREMAKENNYQGVTSTLCYGVQWDAALNFIDPAYITNEVDGKPSCDTTSYVRNSKGMGWYSDNKSGNSDNKTGINVDDRASNAQKNIYDMAGNVYEWTMEIYKTVSRVVRGGNYSDSYPASYRFGNYFVPTYLEAGIGFRPALFITATTE